MKKVGRKVVSVLLTLCMLLTMLPVSALAADEGTVDTAPAENALAESTPVETTEPAVETESGELLDASDSTEQDSMVNTSWYQENSATKEYTITTAAELAGLAQLVNDGTDTFQGWTITLGASIDLADYNWTPIGKNGAPFKGIFDGQNNSYTISNLSINGETLTNAGLFGVLNTPGVIKNVTIENASVTAKSEAGALIGTSHTGTLENCTVTGTVSITANYKVGGLSGGGYADITSCHVTANTGSIVTGTYQETDLEGDNVGGLIGFLGEGDTTLTNCSVSGLTVTGTRKVGGIVGSAFTNNHVEGCQVNNITVASNADADYIANNKSSAGIGGIVGVYTANGAGDGSLTDCSVSGVAFNAPVGVTTGELTAGMRDTTAGELVALPDTMEQDQDLVVPEGVAQIGDQTYPTLEKAFAAVEDNQKTTITLLKDIAVSAPITIGEAKNVIFDMKGHTITAGEGFSTRVFTNNGTLTITGNGTIDVTAAGANGYGAVNNFGILTVVDGTYRNLKVSNASTFYNRSGGTATFENPTIYGGGGCVATEVNTTTTINGGYYENETYPAVENNGNMTITAGTFKNTSCSSCDDSKWGYTVRSGDNSENAYLKIQGVAQDSVKVTGVQGGLAVIGGTADIYNGIYETVACDVHTTGSSAFYAGYFTGESYETAVTIYDGTFQSVSKTAVLVGNDNPPPDSGAGKDSTVMIKGGTFIGGDAAKTAITVENAAYAKGGASISGGTFSSMPSEEFFA